MSGAPRITYDRHGTPGVWAQDDLGAFEGMGMLHARHRPLQALIISAAARGQLSQRLAPVKMTEHLDRLVHRLDIPQTGRRQAALLTERAGSIVDAYTRGFETELNRAGLPFELRLLCAKLPLPNRESILSGLLVSAFVGLSESQERMEEALLQVLQAGASVQTLEHMFHPALKGWEPERLAAVLLKGSAGASSFGATGSNAWALDGSRTATGHAILAGDPHLQIDQLPSLFLEARFAFDNNYWLGATIPGLPAVAVGRNRHLAWSGTFSVGDNIDFTVEENPKDKPRQPSRQITLQRRLRKPLHLRFYDSESGTQETNEPGLRLSRRWAAGRDGAEALGAYLELPLAKNVNEAEKLFQRAHTLSLHWVVADRGGNVLHCQAGSVPKRSNGWSGLYPAFPDSGSGWVGLHGANEMPRRRASDGFVSSANECGMAADGSALSTLAQPGYRMDRIGQVLRNRSDHDPASMQALQLDVYSLQAQRLLPLCQAFLPHPYGEILAHWDLCYDEASMGAHAFEIVRRALLESLAPELGGAEYLALLEHSELSVWWCDALDKLLLDPGSWRGARGDRFARALAELRDYPEPWGEVQRYTHRHMLLGAFPGLSRGPFALPGSVATVRQGNLVPYGGGTPIAVAPAYRFVTDLGADHAFTSLPGGIDGSAFNPSYDRWLNEWRQGEYHRIEPPQRDEL